MKGSASLRIVLPAFVPDLSYDGMPIADGETASMISLKALRNEVSGIKKRLINFEIGEFN
jgi:hypothetical protein